MIRRLRPIRADQHIKGLRPIRQVARKHRGVYRRTIRAAARAARDCGEVWTCNSSYRTYSEQVALYQAYKNGTGNLAAIPGTSRHESGRALDLSDPQGHPIGSSARRRIALARQGFVFAVRSEAWHVEYLG